MPQAMRRIPLGDGDSCPQDPAHGRMYFLGQRQWCPNACHVGCAVYLFDGVTSAAPKSTPDVPGNPVLATQASSPALSSLWEGELASG